MPEILFIDLLKLLFLTKGVRTDRVSLSVGVSSTNRKPLKRQSMKTYCKTVDITDRKLIQKAVYKCLKKKYKRRDSLTMFSEYTGLSTDTIKGMFNEFGLNGMKPMVETVVDGVREEIIQGNQYGTKKRLTLPVRKCEESEFRTLNSKSTIISQ